MFIQTESTPNPNTLKFILGFETVARNSVTYNSAKEASNSPLAKSLFKVENVKSVFFSNDYVSITKSEEAEWIVLKPMVLSAILDHLTAGLPVIDDGHKEDERSKEPDSEIVTQIKAIIEERVKPAVAMDGGDINFYSFDEESGVVKLSMHGACSGCPSSTVTLKNGIENMLKHYIPEITAVEAA